MFALPLFLDPASDGFFRTAPQDHQRLGKDFRLAKKILHENAAPQNGTAVHPPNTNPLFGTPTDLRITLSFVSFDSDENLGSP
jgi:hypothetical protein